ncbi:protein kinase [Streptomyces sp. WMMC500]|uniref:tetratricopeptide repeat protein n=1 Tax=Streptomyces sp. WMMC500 TaxID=3015154 RepID=UPI00248CBD62|nr:tetratricopeptide repeat protein [Streptomyces sp. WMMC500]WBB59277.1 protein kinase [Streptomyces sp. WMMC500]
MTEADPAGAPTRCPHRLFSGAACAGELLDAGYCTRCGRHRDARRLPEPDGGPRDPLVLPEVPAEDAYDSVIPENAPLAYGKRCGNKACGALLAPPLVDPPVPNEGHCPACGHRYSFVPRLREGDMLGQYRVLGCLAHGGQGWVHLAENTRLEDTQVAVKELLNRHDKQLAELAESERRYLIALDHPDIVRILDYLREEPGGAEQPMNYIVMEYVGSNTLEKIVTEVRRGRRGLDIEEVVTYGCRILDALDHLHRRKDPIGPLAYCDMKPSNVIHHGHDLKVIDLGGVRRISETTAPVRTAGYAAPEVDRTGPTVAHDLHTVGRTLEELARFAATHDVTGTGITSFRYVVRCATARDPDDRFASAAEMSEQLRGVLREIRALRDKPDRPEPSTLFVPTRRLLDAGLGQLPPLRRWLERPPPRRNAPRVSEPLDTRPPAAVDVAAALPVPGPHADDPQRALFGLSTTHPDKMLHQPAEKPSAEICFHNVRLHLRRWPELAQAQAEAEARWAKAETAKAKRKAGAEQAKATEKAKAEAERAEEKAEAELKAAADELAEAREILARSPHRTWQLDWHEGLLDLVRAQAAAAGGGAEVPREGERNSGDAVSSEVGELSGAYGHFEAVYRRLPGEYAPKLALGYCAERLAAAGPAATAAGRAPEEMRKIATAHYHTVWHRNRMQGNGAFGLARLALARGSRKEAVDVLDNVPKDSPDHGAAWIATLRVSAARLDSGSDGPALPPLHEIGRARARLAFAADTGSAAPLHLAQEHGLLLEAEFLEWALDQVTRPGGAGPGDGFPYDRLFGEPYRPRAGERPPPRALPSRRGAAGNTSERQIRLLLAACYRKLSRHCRDDDRAKLIELHNAVRPSTVV